MGGRGGNSKRNSGGGSGGYTDMRVHYSEYKNKYAHERRFEGMFNEKLERVERGEYHPEDKTIDIRVPAGKLAEVLPEDYEKLATSDYSDVLPVRIVVSGKYTEAELNAMMRKEQREIRKRIWG